ncbi:NMD3 family protein [uncultured archaeon]|nr:NMD3 family protein [uncultured archaeon]
MHQCPRCGAGEGTKKFVGPFCIDCYEFTIKIPDKLEMRRCKRCGSVKLRGEWTPFTMKKVTDWVKSKFKGEFTSVEFDAEENLAVFTIERDGSKVQIEKMINFEVLVDMCPECNKKSGGYFEAIVQLRGNEARIKKYARIFAERLEKEGTFISKVAELKEGLDLYVGSTKAAMSVITRLGLKYGISTSLSGQKQGKRLYRTSFSIRL